MSNPPDYDGAGVLSRLHATLTRYVVLPSPQAVDAVVLWVASSHAQPAWAHAPRLVIRAPEKRCGKSRLLDVVEATCHYPLITVNASTAAVYRSIGTDDPPTILLDEADTVFGPKAGEAHEDLRGLLNAGHQRNRPALRWDAAGKRLERIPTFAMAALAGIGAMPDTIEDRAIVIRMRRRTTDEWVAPYRHRRDGPIVRHAADTLHKWLRANLARLEHAEPLMPLEDRAADTWEPLIAVADLAGKDWPDRGRYAAETLTAERDGATASSDRIRLLADCRTAFADLDTIPTTVLIDRLKADPEAPWAEYGAAGLTPMRMATLLREYDISSANIRSANFPNGQGKGYRRCDFTDTWQRYCPGPDAGRPAHVRHLRPVPAAGTRTDEMPPPPDAGAAGTA